RKRFAWSRPRELGGGGPVNTRNLLVTVILIVLVVVIYNYGSTSQVPSVQTSHLGQRTKTSGCTVNGPNPDAACTPGAIIATATRDEICRSGYASGVRDVPEAEKNQ